jgi:hypothetical protein
MEHRRLGFISSKVDTSTIGDDLRVNDVSGEVWHSSVVVVVVVVIVVWQTSFSHNGVSTVLVDCRLCGCLDYPFGLGDGWRLLQVVRCSLSFAM